MGSAGRTVLLLMRQSNLQGMGILSHVVHTVDILNVSINVSSQAYLDVSSASNPALSYGADGIAGLGFTSLSTIDALVNRTNTSTGRSLLFSLFEDNPQEPNFISFSMQRGDDPTADVEGTFGIGMFWLTTSES